MWNKGVYSIDAYSRMVDSVDCHMFFVWLYGDRLYDQLVRMTVFDQSRLRLRDTLENFYMLK
jgi:hypothetical protein